MKVLLDTNIAIMALPLTGLELQQSTKEVIAILREAEDAGHNVLVHPIAQNDIRNDKDEYRKRARQILIRRYHLLRDPPGVPRFFREKLGPPGKDINDSIDEALLAAVYLNAVDVLISEDKGLCKKAIRLGLQNRILSLDDSIRAFRALSPKRVTPPPAVNKVTCDKIDSSDPIFASFRSEYVEFDEWFAKCRLEKRDAWMVLGENANYAAICIIKPERKGARSLRGMALKICSFKTNEFGRGLSELLLRTVCDYATNEGYDTAYLEVFPKHAGLINLLEQFGFSAQQERTHRGEIVLEKNFTCPPEELEQISALDYNIKYGPNKIKTEGVPIFIVPVKPIYHALLFPDVEKQKCLLPGRHGFGNTIRKAYLCHSRIGTLPQGAVLVFYRSLDEKSARCIGVVENVLRSSDAKEITRFVGARTVYTADEIIFFCRRRVLAILFRYARPLSIPISSVELITHRVIQGAPRSIVQARSGGVEWIRGMIG